MTWWHPSLSPAQWYRSLNDAQRADTLNWMTDQPEPPWGVETWFAMVMSESPHSIFGPRRAA